MTLASPATIQTSLRPQRSGGVWAFLPLTNWNEGASFTLLDAADAERVGHRRWHVSGQGYAARRFRGDGKMRSERLARVILGFGPGDRVEVDHINRDRLDNRRCNLRQAERRQNGQNVPARGGSSRFRGVTWDKARRKWVAQANHEQKHVFLGRFHFEQNAADAAARFREHHMPFAID